MKKLYWLLLCFVVSANFASAGSNENPPLQTPQAPPRGVIDPQISQQWYLDTIGARRVWQRYTEGSRDTIVAVVDSGIDYNLPEIAYNIWHNPHEQVNGLDDDHNGYVDDIIGWDYVTGKNLPYDRAGHGTFMATIIAGLHGNGIGGSGVCPSCSIMPVRFLNYDGLGDDADAIEAIYYAAKNGARVMNLSFAGDGQNADLLRALHYAQAKDVFVVVAAGNDSENLNRSAVYPAKYDLPNMITVAAATHRDQILDESNYSDKFVHLATPGEDIYGYWLGDWDHGQGTSDAAAVTSGAIGLIRSAAPSLNAAQVKQVVLASVRKVDGLEKKTITGGVLDVEAAVACATAQGLPCLQGGKDDGKTRISK